MNLRSCTQHAGRRCILGQAQGLHVEIRQQHPCGLEEGCFWPGAFVGISERVWLELSYLPIQVGKQLCFPAQS